MMHPDDARERGLGTPRGLFYTLPLAALFWAAVAWLAVAP